MTTPTQLSSAPLFIVKGFEFQKWLDLSTNDLSEFCILFSNKNELRNLQSFFLEEFSFEQQKFLSLLVKIAFLKEDVHLLKSYYVSILSSFSDECQLKIAKEIIQTSPSEETVAKLMILTDQTPFSTHLFKEWHAKNNLKHLQELIEHIKTSADEWNIPPACLETICSFNTQVQNFISNNIFEFTNEAQEYLFIYFPLSMLFLYHIKKPEIISKILLKIFGIIDTPQERASAVGSFFEALKETPTIPDMASYYQTLLHQPCIESSPVCQYFIPEMPDNLLPDIFHLEDDFLIELITTTNLTDAEIDLIYTKYRNQKQKLLTVCQYLRLDINKVGIFETSPTIKCIGEMITQGFQNQTEGGELLCLYQDQIRLVPPFALLLGSNTSEYGPQIAQAGCYMKEEQITLLATHAPSTFLQVLYVQLNTNRGLENLRVFLSVIPLASLNEFYTTYLSEIKTLSESILACGITPKTREEIEKLIGLLRQYESPLLIQARRIFEKRLPIRKEHKPFVESIDKSKDITKESIRRFYLSQEEEGFDPFRGFSPFYQMHLNAGLCRALGFNHIGEILEVGIKSDADLQILGLGIQTLQDLSKRVKELSSNNPDTDKLFAKLLNPDTKKYSETYQQILAELRDKLSNVEKVRHQLKQIYKRSFGQVMIKYCSQPKLKEFWINRSDSLATLKPQNPFTLP